MLSFGLDIIVDVDEDVDAIKAMQQAQAEGRKQHHLSPSTTTPKLLIKQQEDQTTRRRRIKTVWSRSQSLSASAFSLDIFLHF